MQYKKIFILVFIINCAHFFKNKEFVSTKSCELQSAPTQIRFNISPNNIDPYFTFNAIKKLYGSLTAVELNQKWGILVNLKCKE
ncbi:MAG: hypothetical protein SFU98_09335 [Leptospiraceae bacterium]|nr:hypothetical protein [Leptospiraceae bacterium]